MGVVGAILELQEPDLKQIDDKGAQIVLPETVAHNRIPEGVRLGVVYLYARRHSTEHLTPLKVQKVQKSVSWHTCPICCPPNVSSIICHGPPCGRITSYVLSPYTLPVAFSPPAHGGRAA
jgi:hypothetical protein